MDRNKGSAGILGDFGDSGCIYAFVIPTQTDFDSADTPYLCQLLLRQGTR
jgi:hypothetical protein